jgi:NADPH-dependent ferric siderophore reductase
MADRKRSVTELQVVRTERLTPHLIRVVLGGPGFAGYQHNEFTDRYVKLQFPAPGVRYPEPFDLEAIRRDLPREQWPVPRAYTVREVDAAAGELTIDFVYHGDEGIAGPWAAAARPGDLLRLVGPGGGYVPSPDADWHLLVGDEAALPAIGSALEEIPVGVPAHAFLQVADAAEELKFDTVADARITWLHRDAGPADLVAAVAAFEFPAGVGQAFVHGEAGFAMPLRRALAERGIAKDLLSVSGYWRRGRTDEQWRAEKSELRRQEEARA